MNCTDVVYSIADVYTLLGPQDGLCVVVRCISRTTNVVTTDVIYMHINVDIEVM